MVVQVGFRINIVKQSFQSDRIDGNKFNLWMKSVNVILERIPTAADVFNIKIFFLRCLIKIPV